MFACLYIPDFPVQAVVRSEVGLREQTVAVLDGKPPLLTVFAANPKARLAGIVPGMTRLEAEALSGLKLRRRSPQQEAAAHAALLDCAQSFSPRVEETALDTVVADLSGLERLFGVPPEMARELTRRATEMGLEANVAVAANLETAVLAARGFLGVTVIAAGQEAERLGMLPLDVLAHSPCKTAPAPALFHAAAPSAACHPAKRDLGFSDFSTPRLSGTDVEPQQDILETLHRWGIRNLRALAALPEVAVRERLGEAGGRWLKLARGQGARPLMPAQPPLRFEEAMELEYPVAELEPLAFILARLLEQLCARLAARALATNELRLQLAGGRRQEAARLRRDFPASCTLPAASCGRVLRLPVPMLDEKVFLKLLQLDLKAHPPAGPVTGVWLSAEPAKPRPAQNGLYQAGALAPERLQLTLARLAGVVGEARAGSPELEDTHRPDGFRMKSFSPGTLPNCRTAELPNCQIFPSVIPRKRDLGFEFQFRSSAVQQFCNMGSSATQALRIFRPALPATVEERDRQPVRIAFSGVRGELVALAGPWLTSGHWWRDHAWARQEWDVALRHQGTVAVYRLYRDLEGGGWFVQGSYD